MMNRVLPILVLIAAISCESGQKEKEKSAEWQFIEQIQLDESIRPLSIAKSGDTLWVSDPDNHRVVAIDRQGKTLHTLNDLERPMHIEINNKGLLIPNFAVDSISVYTKNTLEKVTIKDSLDAPSGISVQEDVMAIADFYNHRIVLANNDKNLVIGSKGHADGMLNYPTDVKLYKDNVVVADAYNNRVQVFDLNGNFLKVIGWQEDIKVATGVDVYNDQIYVTDYYGNRLLIYDFEGNLITILSEQFNKPTDVFIQNDTMYVANYGSNELTLYSF